MDPASSMSWFVATALAIVVLGLVMKQFKQPYVVAYLLVGVVLGPSGFAVIHSQHVLAGIGDMGVVLLLFFIGMEVSPQRLLSHWVISVVGTFIQILISIAVVGIFGWMLGWSIDHVVLIGCVISLSSSAVVLKLLQDWGEIDKQIGQEVMGILLVQDLMVVPMMIALNSLSGHHLSSHNLILQVIGGLAAIGLVIWLMWKKKIKLPFIHYVRKDHEMQVFSALILCFGMAMLSVLFKLSAPLGAFLAGMLVAATEHAEWVKRSLLSLRTIFIALFFVSIGMLINLDFLWHHLIQIFLLVIAAYVLNTIINAIILRVLGETWNMSIYGASLLAQIGEFSFVIASVGWSMGIVQFNQYQLLITVIALSLFFSPLWIAGMKKIARDPQKSLQQSVEGWQRLSSKVFQKHRNYDDEA